MVEQAIKIQVSNSGTKINNSATIIFEAPTWIFVILVLRRQDYFFFK